MGLRDWVARRGARTAHVLVVEVPGAWPTRVRVEQQVGARGWRLALSPADADVLAVCGTPGPALDAAVSKLWDLMPGPRARISLGSPGAEAVSERLRGAEQALLDVRQQYDDSRARPTAPEAEQQSSGHTETHHGMDHGDMDHGGGHEGMDHEGGHGGMEMAPDGIPLAQGGEDRDGLEMDVLNVRLGPVLPYWPAGLVLRCSLQGDVIVEAQADRIDGDHEAGSRAMPQPLDRLLSAAVRCDNASTLLMLAGWDDAGAQARRVRDRVLWGKDPAEAGRALERLRRKVAGSFLLRRALQDIGYLGSADLERHGLPERLRGDARDRLLTMLDRAWADLHPAPGLSVEQPAPQPVDLESVPHLVVGRDLATARLLVSSLDLDPLQPGMEVAHA